MKRFKNFLNKPWTWGTYLKLSAISIVITIFYMLAYLGFLKWQDKQFEEAFNRNTYKGKLFEEDNEA